MKRRRDLPRFSDLRDGGNLDADGPGWLLPALVIGVAIWAVSIGASVMQWRAEAHSSQEAAK